MPPKTDQQQENRIGSKKVTTDNSHQFQARTGDEEAWKQKEPYKMHSKDEEFVAKWWGSCYCGRVQYQLSREVPLDAKYCHCTTCQRLHRAPFQWAAIFHKSDINFTNGMHDIGWYESSEKSVVHKLPCKVSCAFCRTPIMDEGRTMILLFPTLIEGINTPQGRKAFKPACHIFYPQRVCDIKDGLDKWAGLDFMSDKINDEGEVVEEYRKRMQEEMNEKRQKRQKDKQQEAEKEQKK